LVEAEALGHVADALLDALRLAHDVVTDDGSAPARRLQDAAEHADGRRFAGAVRAEDAEDLAAAHAERDVAHGDEIAEATLEVLRFDDDVVHGRVAFPPGPPRSMVTNAGTPACSRSSGSSTRTRTRTTRFGRSRGLNKNRGVNSVRRETCSTVPRKRRSSESTRSSARSPTSMPASSPCGTKTST